MNIAYILHATITNGGGTKAFLNILEGLKDKNVTPYIITPDKKGIYNTLKDKGYQVYAFTFRDSCYSHTRTIKEYILFLPRMMAKMVANRIAVRKLCTIIKEKNIELIHTNTSIVNIGYRAAKKNAIPHIYHIREYGDLDFGRQYFPTKKTLLKQLSDNNCYSICITKDIQKHYKQQNNNRSRVIYDGVFKKATIMPISTSKDYFLYAGRIEPAKGLDQLLIAYNLYCQQSTNPLKLLVAGSCLDTSYVQQQKNYIKQYKLNDLAILLGERDNISELMVHAKAIIIPSRSEGFGFCMPEAMQQGCLAIARNTGGTKEQLDNALEKENEEIALRYDTTEELCSLLKEVGDNPISNFSSYTQRAFNIVNEFYSLENNTNLIFNYYKDILHDKNH